MFDTGEVIMQLPSDICNVAQRSTPYCMTCGAPFSSPAEMLLIWNETPDGRSVAEIAVVHKDRCDNEGFMSSGGAAYGDDWFTDKTIMVRALELLGRSSTATRGVGEAAAGIAWTIYWDREASR